MGWPGNGNRMDKFALAQDVLKHAGGSVGAGFNRRVQGMTYNECFRFPTEQFDRELHAGWDKADEMIKEGKLFYVHNFHNLACHGYAFQYGGCFVCNTCQRERLEREWWKIKVMKDGTAWCCVGNGFVNLQESDNYAFGDTREDAIEKYGAMMYANHATHVTA